MLRKTSIAIALSMLSAPGFSGLYVGASIGPEGALFTQKAHVLKFGTFDVIEKQHYSGVGFFGSVFAGYGWTHKQFYLAGEVNANLSSVEYQLTNDEYVHNNFAKTTFAVKYSEGISALPGIFLSNRTLFYGRVGYINGRLKIHETNPTIPSMNKNLGGIRYGFGLRHDLNECWTMMMDYSQINYDDVRGYYFEPFSGVEKVTTVNPNTAQVALGLLYKFDAPKGYVK